MYTLKKIFPSLPETERGRPNHIKADPKGKYFIYSISNSVIMRSVENPADAQIVTNHAKKVTSVCYAPSGFYIASGDVCGNLKIWDTVNEEHAVKYEYGVLSSSVYDIAWSEDSKRIVAVGDGREKYGSVIAWDTGTSCGSVGYHTKALLSVDFKKVRPFALVTGGEDMTVLHHTGPPFKYDKSNEIHTNFVNCVRYSHDGLYAASAGKEGKIFVYDGKTLTLLHELNGGASAKAHEGGVYSISWSPCGKKLLSASGDKTCKIWNVVENKCETVFEMGHDVIDQQLGCLWMNEHLITVALSGKITFLDQSNPTTPKKVYFGHNKGIISACVSDDKACMVTGSYDGTLNYWDVATGCCVQFSGSHFPNQISSISLKGDTVLAVGIGKLAYFGSLSTKNLSGSVGLDSEPLCAQMLDSDFAVIGCLNSINLIHQKSLVHNVPLPYETVSVAGYGGSDNNENVAVVCNDGKVRFYSIAGNQLKLIQGRDIVLESNATQISLSHDRKNFLVAAASKSVFIYDVETLKLVASWAAHANRVNCASYSADDKYVATCGIDGAVNVWKAADPDYRIEIRVAHRTYNSVAVFWITPNMIASVGQQDCTVKFWELKL